MKSIVQFVSHVAPPSTENACSQRGTSGLGNDQMKCTRMDLPLNSSSA
jgi:hypothetical protein